MKLRIYGSIKDTKTGQTIIDANVKLFLDKQELQEVKSIKNGFFEITTEIDDSRIESGQQLRVTIEKEGYQMQEHRVFTTEGSFNLDVELEPVVPTSPPKKSFNMLPVIIGGGVLIALLVGGMITWLLLRPSVPQIKGFSSDTNSIEIGESAILHWDTKNASLVKIEPDIGEVKSRGDIKVKPDRTTEYKLTAMNEEENFISKALTVQVVDKKSVSELLDTSDKIQTKSGGLNIMGNVGIGTTSPKVPLHIVKNQNKSTNVVISNKDIGDSAYTNLQLWAGNDNYLQSAIYSSGVGYIVGSASGKLLYGNVANAPVTFKTNNIERLIIDSSGNVGIGTTNPGANKLRVDGYTLLGGGIANSHFPWSGNGWAYVSGKGIIFREDAAGKYVERMRIADNGNVGIGTTAPREKLHVIGNVKANNYLRNSDVRFKKNITIIDNALDKVSALRGIVFEWRIEEYPERGLDEGQEIGLIAQEVEEVLPNVVSEDNDGYKSLDYSRFSPVLIEAIKELKTEIDELREENADLKERIAVLEKNY